jgi:hypothetical protein
VTNTNVYRNGKVHVQEKKCDTCIFRPSNIMQLEPGRKDSMLAEAIADGGVIPCHQTIYGARKQESVCRGFFDVAKHEGLLGLAERLGIIEFTPTDYLAM